MADPLVYRLTLEIDDAIVDDILLRGIVPAELIAAILAPDCLATLIRHRRTLLSTAAENQRYHREKHEHSKSASTRAEVA